MKRLAAIIIAAVAAFAAVACGTALERREPNISELRDVLMKAESERMKVTLMSGVREEPFAVDGVPGGKTDFTVIVIEPKGAREDAAYDYVLYAGGEKREGKLNKHPFRGTWSTELPIRTSGGATLTLTSEGYMENLELADVTTGAEIGASEALEIAEKRLKDRIAEHSPGGKLAAEIYVRYLDNPISSDGGYYWYVAIVPAKYEVYAVLVDPTTGEIAAVRE